MSFVPPASYQRLLDLGYLAIDSEDMGVHWTSQKRWNVSQREDYELHNIPLEPEIQREFESLGHYHEFAADPTGDSFCWHEHHPTVHDEYEIHQVAIFLYTPYAPSFPLFLFRKLLQELAFTTPPKGFIPADFAKISESPNVFAAFKKMLSLREFSKFLSVNQKWRNVKKRIIRPFEWPQPLREQSLDLLHGVLDDDHLNLLRNIKSQIQAAFKDSAPNPFTESDIAAIEAVELPTRFTS